jgi:hypothetical protein
MTIQLTFSAASVEAYARTGAWIVKHENNGLILAYCTTQEEAEALARALGELPDRLASLGYEAGPL